jgi:tetratricopeptide (TPR) repeat protein
MHSKVLILITVILVLSPITRADTYSTFKTTRFYSADGRYFVEVTPNKRGTLYANGRSLERRWSRTLPELPARLFLTNDGTRVVMVDYYYGNNGTASANVVIIFDEAGNQIAAHPLAAVANISRVLQTTSSAHWYYGALFTPDQTTFIVETVVRTCDPPNTSIQSQKDLDAFDKCMRAEPYEELHFSLATGALTSRFNIQTKYTDRETKLVHDLELVEAEHPLDKLNLVNSLVGLAHFYADQKQYAKAKDLYERAIPIYSGALGANFFLVAELVGDAATNYRQLGDYRRAQELFLRALTSLDRGQGDPASVSPVAITVYEEYAVLLRRLNRNAEAGGMERRAQVLRSAYPDYKAAATR